MDRRPRHSGLVALGAAVALVVGACSGGGSATSSPSSAAATSAPSNAAGVSSDFVTQVAAAVASASGKQTVWTGPTTGPKTSRGKHIVYLSGQETNSLSHAYGTYLQDAASKIGWTVTVIDGKGTPTGWLDGMNQAIALKPDGIVIFADAVSLKDAIATATAQHIPVVGLHAAGEPGPSAGLFTNIQESPQAIGKAEADFAIADSNGTGRVIIIYHGEYAIAQVKAQAMKDELAKCTTCKLLEYTDFPAAESAQRTPQLVTTWVSKYGPPFYALSVGDNDWDFAVPSLTAGGVKPSDVRLVASDGTPGSYARIRQGDQYQVATVPEPTELQGYQAIDELNRAMNGQPPSGYVAPVFIVTKDNIGIEGGPQNQFIPSNGYKDQYLKIWGVTGG